MKPFQIDRRRDEDGGPSGEPTMNKETTEEAKPNQYRNGGLFWNKPGFETKQETEKKTRKKTIRDS